MRTALGLSLIVSAGLLLIQTTILSANTREAIPSTQLEQASGGSDLLWKCPSSCNEENILEDIRSCIGDPNGASCRSCEEQATVEVYVPEEQNPHCEDSGWSQGQPLDAYDCGQEVAGVCVDQGCDTEGQDPTGILCDDAIRPQQQAPSSDPPPEP